MELVIPFAQFTVHFADEKCDYKNVKDCSGLENGSRCWDDRYAFSSCSDQMACGFCYYGSCLITLGEEGDICGLGSGGRCEFNCDSATQTEDTNGRRCKEGLKCCNFKNSVTQ